MSMKWKAAVAASVVGALALSGCGGSSSGSDSGADSLSLVGFSILEQANKQVIADFTKTADGKGVEFEQSYGASGDQSRAVEGGQKADVVHFSLEPDIQRLVDSKQVAADWNKTPTKGILTQSVVVLVVRKGNPKGIQDWGDLVKDGVEVITPNPKTSGGARWAYLAAWNYGYKTSGNDEAKAQDFIKQVYQHVPVLGTGARDSTVTFAQKGLGDVYLAWENEAYLVLQEFGADNFDIVYPKSSIKAEPPVAVVSKNAEAHGTTDLAKAYLDYLYSPEAQTLEAKNHYRPSNPDSVTDKALLDAFPKIDLVSIDDPEFGGWATVQPKHFGDGGIFDQIYTPAQ